jgi:hypothetical protein
LTPSLGLPPVLPPAIIPNAALSAVHPVPTATIPDAGVKTASPPVAGEPVKSAAPGAGKIAAPVGVPADGTEKAAVPGAQTFDGTSRKPAPIDLDALEAVEGEAVVDVLMRDYHPAGHAFVGVGRSPAIIVALMQNRNPALARTLPLSDFYHHPGGHAKYYAPLPPELETRLFDHLDRYLPPESLSGAKKLVLIDFVKGGRSMIALDEYLKRFASRRYPALRWEFFGLGLGEEHAGFTESGRSYRVLTPKELDEAAPRPILHTRMSFSWNKDLAEYGEFPAPFENAAALERRAEYEAWRKRLAERKTP